MKLDINEDMQNERVDKLISNIFNISRSKISKATIYVNEKIVKTNYKVKLKDIVRFDIEEEKNEIFANNIDFDIIYEDEYLAIIDKPYNLVVHPSNSFNGNTLVGALLNKFSNLSNIGENRNGIVHRLDKDTSGLMIIAKDNDTHIKLQEMFKKHKLIKIYLALLKGNFKYDNIRVESFIGRDKKDRKKMSKNTNKGKLAISEFEKIISNEKISLVKVKIFTGRTHQIRVHSKELGYAVLGDKLYSKKPLADRQQLHSYYLEFIHPITNKKLEIKSNIPKDMIENIKKYGLGEFSVRI